MLRIVEYYLLYSSNLLNVSLVKKKQKTKNRTKTKTKQKTQKPPLLLRP
jgi:hypothetical protein